MPRLVVAGTSSGVGKTTATLALTRALRAKGLRVAVFKCGPDYLDPTYHARAAGSPCQNLDGWMMGKDAVRATFARATARAQADVALIEGVMGLYDGASPTGPEGSTAEIARWLDAPVVLVVDASGMARSIAALVQGFAAFDPELRIGAVLANRVGGAGHLDLLRSALLSRLLPPLLGGFPRDDAHGFPERHLGLFTADEVHAPEALLDHWGKTATAWCAIDAILALARSAAPSARTTSSSSAVTPHEAPTRDVRCRIGLARDEAFHFYYDDNLAQLEAEGAEIVPFSPLGDAALPDIDGLYLGGGYPEVHAERLAANASMLASVRAFAARGGPVYAECGGLMYLSDAIVTLDGARHAMAGLVPGEARMSARLQALGYVEVETQAPSILGEAGTRFRGHQFRYSELVPQPSVDRVYAVRARRGGEELAEGYSSRAARNVLASYVHAHWASTPAIARSFVESCACFASQRASE